MCEVEKCVEIDLLSDTAKHDCPPIQTMDHSTILTLRLPTYHWKRAMVGDSVLLGYNLCICDVVGFSNRILACCLSMKNKLHANSDQTYKIVGFEKISEFYASLYNYYQPLLLQTSQIHSRVCYYYYSGLDNNLRKYFWVVSPELTFEINYNQYSMQRERSCLVLWTAVVQQINMCLAASGGYPEIRDKR